MTYGYKMFRGSIVALVTPMNKNKSIDLISLRKLINYHIISGTAAIVIAGTTGEQSTLSREEHYNLTMHSLEFSNGRIPIIVGTGANSTSDAIFLTSRFNDSGVSGCLNITPYYNIPSQEGLYQHFKAISEYTNLPQILYNVPKRTGCDMLPCTIARLSEIKNIIGIKEATGNLNRVNLIQELAGSNFLLLSGDDASALDFMQLGGNGVISVTANIAAKEMVAICNLAANGKYIAARRLNRCLMPLHKKLFFESNPIPIKWACKILGLISTDALRLPMTSLTKLGVNIMKKALIDSGLL